MVATAELLVRIIGDTSKLKSALGEVEGQSSKLGSVLGGIGKAAAAGLAVGGAAVGAFGLKALNTAADLGEIESKLKAISGAASGEIIDFGNQMAESFGLAKGQVLEGASAFAGLFKNAGQTGSQLAATSTEFTHLAADASSFFNIPFEEALQKLRAGLAGESEPLKSLNVFMNEAAVEAKAMELGIAKAGEKLTEQQKITARSAVIMEQMGDVTGDLARTQDSLPNQLRKVTGAFQNMAAEVGKDLIPVVTDVVKEFQPFVKVLGESLGNAAKAVVPLIARVGEVFARLLPKLLPIVEVLATGLLAVFEALLPAIEPLVDALADGLLEVLEALLPVLPDLAKSLAVLIKALTPLIPVIASVIALAVRLVGFALKPLTFLIQNVVAPVLRFLVGVLAGVADAFSGNFATIKNVAIGALQFVIDKFLAFVGVLVKGAAAAFGWVPGIGPKLKEAAAQFDDFRNRVNGALNGIKDRFVVVDIRTRFTVEQRRRMAEDLAAANAAARRAHGGPVQRGRAFVVGERGPELFIPTANGQIVPNGQFGGGQTVITANITVNGADDPTATAKAVQQALLRMARSNPSVLRGVA